MVRLGPSGNPSLNDNDLRRLVPDTGTRGNALRQFSLRQDIDDVHLSIRVPTEKRHDLTQGAVHTPQVGLYL